MSEASQDQPLAGITFTSITLDRRLPFEFSDSRPVVHTHIKKTGGTTLWRILSGALSAVSVPHNRLQGECYEADHLETKLGTLKTEGLSVVGGHVPYGLHRFTAPPLYMTVLRDPEDLYQSILRMAAGRGLVTGGVAERQAFLAATPDNIQTRMLAGCLDRSEPCSASMLSDAQINLEHSYAFGLQDDLANFMKQMFSLFGMFDVVFSDFQTAKVQMDPVGLPPHHIEFDRQLWQWARRHQPQMNQLEALVNRLEVLVPLKPAADAPAPKVFQVSSHLLGPSGVADRKSASFFQPLESKPALLQKIRHMGGLLKEI